MHAMVCELLPGDRNPSRSFLRRFCGRNSSQTNFTNLPVDLNVFKADLDSYAVSIADAKDGGKKAIALRNKLGEVVISTMKILATYVELHCKDDMNIFLLCSAEHNWNYVLSPVMWCSMLNGLVGELFPGCEST